MTTATIHTDTTIPEEIKIQVLTIFERERKFIHCDIGGVSLIIGHETAELLVEKLSIAMREFESEDDINNDLIIDDRDKSEIRASNRPDDFDRPRE